ncbi:MAG: iron-containing alcohol dehydrogenase [Faecousia sp.]
MNPLEKAYCRSFQCIMHAVLPLLPYREPEILDSVERVAPLCASLHISSVLLVTDAGLRGAGATDKLETLLREAGIRCAVYDQTRANPTVENVEQARTLYLNEKCEALIAFGGGSSMDCAKAVGARIAYPKKELYRLKGLLRVLRRIPTLIAIPTTAGTGSETTITAVITDTKKKHKYTMNNFTLIPRYAVLDPGVTYTLPPSLTATTGMDALTHAVEAYIGGSTSKETRRLSLEAVRLIFANIERAYNDGHNRAAREAMLRAAYQAGIAFSKSYVGYIHAVAHSLGGQYNIPHGLANAVLMPIVLEDYGAAAHKKLHELAVAAGVATESETDAAAAEKLIRAIRELNQRMSIPATLSGIQKADIPQMAKYADKEANPLYPVPKLMDAGELERFYEKAADWS